MRIPAALALLCALCFVACGDFGGRGDTDIPCDKKEKWPEYQCPTPMMCNMQTNMCSTAVCRKDEDCACGTRMHPGIGVQQKCICALWASTKSGRLGTCYRAYP